MIKRKKRVKENDKEKKRQLPEMTVFSIAFFYSKSRLECHIDKKF